MTFQLRGFAAAPLAGQIAMGSRCHQRAMLELRVCLSMRHAHSGTRLIVGEGRGGRLAVFGCSLLGVFLQACRQFMSAAVLTHSTRRIGRSQES